MATQYDCFEGNVAVIVGGVEGIGRACALGFAGQGAKVVVADIRDEAGEELSALAARDGNSLYYKRTDATNPAAVAELRAFAEGEGAGGWPWSIALGASLSTSQR